jgi:hypothetical protein
VHDLWICSCRTDLDSLTPRMMYHFCIITIDRTEEQEE